MKKTWKTYRFSSRKIWRVQASRIATENHCQAAPEVLLVMRPRKYRRAVLTHIVAQEKGSRRAKEGQSVTPKVSVSASQRQHALRGRSGTSATIENFLDR